MTISVSFCISIVRWIFIMIFLLVIIPVFVIIVTFFVFVIVPLLFFVILFMTRFVHPLRWLTLRPAQRAGYLFLSFVRRLLISVILIVFFFDFTRFNVFMFLLFSYRTSNRARTTIWGPEIKSQETHKKKKPKTKFPDSYKNSKRARTIRRAIIMASQAERF